MNTSDALVLITGASGFIGGSIARVTRAQGFKVRAFVRKNSPRANIDPQYEIAEGCITDRASIRAALAGVRFVFHAAGDYRLWTPDPERLLRTNVEGTRLVMEEALRAGVERIVHTSSTTTLAPDAFGLSDETRRYPLAAAKGAYKRSKIIAESIVEEMVEKEGAPVVIVNPSAPLGPGDVRPTPTGRIVLEALRGHIPAFVDTGLDIVHVDDIAKGHILALQQGRIGERYILGGDNISLATLLTEVAHLAGLRPPFIKLPRPPLFPVAYINEALARLTGREPFLSVESLRLAATSMFFDDGKARRELGYQSRPHGDAIVDAVRWFHDGRQTTSASPFQSAL